MEWVQAGIRGVKAVSIKKGRSALFERSSSTPILGLSRSLGVSGYDTLYILALKKGILRDIQVKT
jgi:hypothetical protein